MCGTCSSASCANSGGCRLGSARATRCGPRWATRCTVRTCRCPYRHYRRDPRGLSAFGKDAFWGRDALLAEKAAGPRRTLLGLEALDRGIPRAHMAVLDASGAQVGEVTSGTFSPTLKKGIGLALIDTASGVGAGDEVVVDVRGRRIAVRVVKPPFVESHVR